MYKLLQRSKWGNYYLVGEKTVRVQPHFSFCGRCGRPLTDETSQRKGFGRCCARHTRELAMHGPKVLLAIKESNHV